jgi:hypothetical protein
MPPSRTVSSTPDTVSGNSLAQSFERERVDGMAPAFIGSPFLSLQFWMHCREDLRKIKRITLLWDYIRQVTEQNQGLLTGESREMLFVDQEFSRNQVAAS